MPHSISRRDRLPDPVYRYLKDVRKGLLRLHKALIDAERAVFERDNGPMSNGRFLQALIQDPFFAWLRPYSGLIVEIDEAFAGPDPLSEPAAREFVERVRALVEPADAEEAARYERVRQRDPGVLLAHVELASRIAAGPGGAA